MCAPRQQERLLGQIASLEKFPGYLAYLVGATCSDVANRGVEIWLRKMFEKYFGINQKERKWWAEMVRNFSATLKLIGYTFIHRY